MAALEFITSHVCPFAQRTHMALIEKGLEFKRTEIDLAAKPDWFNDVSPYGKVPVLRHGDAVLYESSIINEYLEEAFPTPPLMPTSQERRAMARIWVDFADAYFVPTMYKLLLAQEAERRKELKEELTRHLVFMEERGMARLSEGPYWLGAAVTLVDLSYYPWFERFPALTHYRGMEIPARCRRLKAWVELMKKRESARATAHDEAYFVERYRRYADDTAEGVTARELRRA